METITDVERPGELYVGGEQELLARMLDRHRATLLWKCSGLQVADLKRKSVSPSALSLLDLLRHLTGAERYWFQACLDGRDLTPLYATTADGEIDEDDPTPLDAVVQNYLDACEESRKIAAAHPIGEVVASAVARAPVSARFIALHMVEEYARHNGHADLLRESIDGSVGQ
jgi:hypothetical protein